MVKKFFYFILGAAGLLVVAYVLQPIGKGTGYDNTTKYQQENHWLDLPTDLKLGNPTGIDVDTNQHIVIFHRADREWPLLGAMPDFPIKSKTILIVDRDNGKLLDSWGDNLFIMPHGLKVDHENNIWVTDVGLHQVFKFSDKGKLLMKVGEAKLAGNDSLHFNRPTDIAIAKDGSFYVSDGYGNSRILKFSASGSYLFEWGRRGAAASELTIPHGITLDNEENVYVADRENNRIQVFSPEGKFLKQYTSSSFGAIGAVAFDGATSKMYAVDDISFLRIKHRGSDLIILDTAGKVQTRFGRSGWYQGGNSWYHAVTVDKDGNVYVGDILGNTVQKFKKVSGL